MAQPQELPKREEMRPLPIAPYAVSKLAAESYCRSFHEVCTDSRPLRSATSTCSGRARIRAPSTRQ